MESGKWTLIVKAPSLAWNDRLTPLNRNRKRNKRQRHSSTDILTYTKHQTPNTRPHSTEPNWIGPNKRLQHHSIHYRSTYWSHLLHQSIPPFLHSYPSTVSHTLSLFPTTLLCSNLHIISSRLFFLAHILASSTSPSAFHNFYNLPPSWRPLLPLNPPPLDPSPQISLRPHHLTNPSTQYRMADMTHCLHIRRMNVIAYSTANQRTSRPTVKLPAFRMATAECLCPTACSMPVRMGAQDIGGPRVWGRSMGQEVRQIPKVCYTKWQSGVDGEMELIRSYIDTSHVPCKFFRTGQCQAGKACPFSHSTDVSTVDTPCKYFAKVPRTLRAFTLPYFRFCLLTDSG